MAIRQDSDDKGIPFIEDIYLIHGYHIIRASHYTDINIVINIMNWWK